MEVNLGRVGFVNKGNYIQDFDYKVNDIVKIGLTVYACIVAHKSPLSGFVDANWILWLAPIDDAPIDDKVYGRSGSQWIEIDKGTLRPEFTSLTTSVNQGSSVSLPILNYFNTIVYTVESLSPTVASAEVVGSNLVISGETVTKDTVTTVKIKAQAGGLTPSEWTEISVTVFYVPIEFDETVSIASFKDNVNFNDGWGL